MAITRTESSVIPLCSLLYATGRKKILFDKIDNFVINGVVSPFDVCTEKVNDQILDRFRLHEPEQDWLDEKKHDWLVSEKSLGPVCVSF